MSHGASRDIPRLELGAELERRVEELARVTGMPATEVVREALDEYASRRSNGTEPAASETLYDRAKRANLIGCLKGAPADLSTNPTHMEGFGRE